MHAPHFPGDGSHLVRYAARFRAVEINSSFYRPHRPATYARWAASVPDDFRFAVKVPREITHERGLVDSAAPLDRFLDEVAALEAKLGPLLVQLPPKLHFDATVAVAFFTRLRERCKADVVCEPRHASWLGPAATQLLTENRVARVAADPAVIPEAAEPGAWRGLTYYRMHGSPRTYYSSYRQEFLKNLAARLPRASAAWCIFDNTALGAAQVNALELMQRVVT